MLQTVRCIKFGEVLLDENRDPFLLCVKCHSDFATTKVFRKHLENCFHELFLKNSKLAFDVGTGKKLKGNMTNGLKEFRVYRCNEVHGLEPSVSCKNVIPVRKMDKDDDYIDLINIREELLDPRWYTNVTEIESTSETNPDKVLAYNELVEAVTPYVQFKENFKACENSTMPKKCTRVLERNMNALPKDTVTNDSRKRQFQQKDATNYSEISYAVKKRHKLETKDSLPVSPQVQMETTLNLYESGGEKNKSATAQELTQFMTKRHKSIIIPAKNICLEAQSELECAPQETASVPLKIYQWKAQKTQLVGNTNATIRPVANCSHNISQLRTVDTAAQKQKQKIQTATQAPPLPGLKEQSLAVLVAPAPKEQQTALILNKLQTLGLQVKRSNPPPMVSIPTHSSIKSNEVDELLKKLQSKGMHIKLLPKNAEAREVGKLHKLNLGTAITGAVLTSKPGLNKGIIIKRVK